MSVAGQAGDTPGTHVQRVREEGGLFFSHLGGLSGAECRFRGVFYEKGFLPDFSTIKERTIPITERENFTVN